MSPLPKRSWLRYSVKTLLVAVTILCVWLGREVRIVRERNKTWAEWEAAYNHPTRYPQLQVTSVVLPLRPTTELGWLRKQLGDELHPRLTVLQSQRAEYNWLARLFPETRFRFVEPAVRQPVTE